MKRKLYYFDNNATTRIDPAVLEAMLPFLTEEWGNPSSAYSFGNDLIKHLELAREKIASLIHAEPREIVFTSCGTESNNTAIHSAIRSKPGKRHIITTAVEHSANIKYCKFLQTQGYDITFLPVEPDGSLDIHLLVESLRPDTAIVSIMWANNETGVLLPIEEVSAICQSHHIAFHTDAVQVAGKLKIDVGSIGADFLSLSAHKLNAPKGIGALYIKKRRQFQPMILGGQQERGRRGGTENVPYIVGFGKAAELAVDNIKDETARVRKMRDRLEDSILRSITGTMRNGSRKERLPNTSNIGFTNVEAEAILLLLNQLDICASSGSACTTGSVQPSHVLTAMGLSSALARSSVRFSLGKYNTEEEVDYVLTHLPVLIRKLRGTTEIAAAA